MGDLPAIYSLHLLGASIIEQAEAVSSDASATRLRDVERRRHGHCSVGRVASSSQHLKTDLGRQGLAARHATIPTEHGRSPRREWQSHLFMTVVGLVWGVLEYSWLTCDNLIDWLVRGFRNGNLKGSEHGRAANIPIPMLRLPRGESTKWRLEWESSPCAEIELMRVLWSLHPELSLRINFNHPWELFLWSSIGLCHKRVLQMLMKKSQYQHFREANHASVNPERVLSVRSFHLPKVHWIARHGDSFWPQMRRRLCVYTRQNQSLYKTLRYCKLCWNRHLVEIYYQGKEITKLFYMFLPLVFWVAYTIAQLRVYHLSFQVARWAPGMA